MTVQPFNETSLSAADVYEFQNCFKNRGIALWEDVQVNNVHGTDHMCIHEVLGMSQWGIHSK